MRTPTATQTSRETELIKVETVPAGKTLYITIDLKIPAAPVETAVFIPDGFVVSQNIDLVIYLRGFKIDDKVVTMDDYFKKSYGKLREGVNASGRNVILVAPALGPKSQAGTLVKPGGLDAFVGQVLRAALRHGGFLQPPPSLTLSNLIVAGHSGGGAPTRAIAGGTDKALKNLRECWGYDSLNNAADLQFWPGWSANNASKRLLLFYLPNGTPVAKRCEKLRDMRLANVAAQKSVAPDHMHVPITHWRSNLEAAAFLAPKTGVGAQV